jgi:hypothetical protein
MPGGLIFRQTHIRSHFVAREGSPWEGDAPFEFSLSICFQAPVVESVIVTRRDGAGIVLRSARTCGKQILKKTSAGPIGESNRDDGSDRTHSQGRVLVFLRICNPLQTGEQTSAQSPHRLVWHEWMSVWAPPKKMSRIMDTAQGKGRYVCV